MDGGAQTRFPVWEIDEFDLGAGEVDRRRGAVQPTDRVAGPHDVGERNVVVDHEHPKAGLRERRGDVDRRRRLADAALLVGDRDHARGGRRWEAAAAERDAALGVLRQLGREWCGLVGRG